jgi:hypothetical protein
MNNCIAQSHKATKKRNILNFLNSLWLRGFVREKLAMVETRTVK